MWCWNMLSLWSASHNQQQQWHELDGTKHDELMNGCYVFRNDGAHRAFEVFRELEAFHALEATLRERLVLRGGHLGRKVASLEQLVGLVTLAGRHILQVHLAQVKRHGIPKGHVVYSHETPFPGSGDCLAQYQLFIPQCPVSNSVEGECAVNIPLVRRTIVSIRNMINCTCLGVLCCTQLQTVALRSRPESLQSK
jgi:hypothetical protein